MTEEMQAEVQETTEPVESADNTPEQSESSPEPEKVTFSDEQQKIVDGIVGKKVFATKEAERKNEALQRQLEEVQAQIPKETRPDVPLMPEAFDDDFESKVQQRDEAIRKAASFDAQQQLQQQQEQQQAAAKQQEEVQVLNTKIQTYAENARQSGIDAQQLQTAGNIVTTFGLRADVTEAILGEQDGALMTLYLAANPIAIEQLNSANTIAIGSLYQGFKTEAAKLKPKTTSAPAPLEDLPGAAVLPSERGPRGATYE